MNVLDQLLRDADSCVTCGKPHTWRPPSIEEGRWSGSCADPGDGHALRRPALSVEWLRAWLEAHR